MANANVYTLFRNLAADSATPYQIADAVVFAALDQAIDVLSAILPKWKWEKNVEFTESDLSQGYKSLTSDIQFIDKRRFPGENIWWRIDGSNKIYLIDSELGVPFTSDIRYKAKYVKFKGAQKDQTLMDIPTSAEFAVALYALGQWLTTTGMQVNSDSAIEIAGNIKSKSEENMRVDYGFTTESILNNPEKVMEKASDLMRALPGSQDDIFSVASFM